MYKLHIKSRCNQYMILTYILGPIIILLTLITKATKGIIKPNYIQTKHHIFIHLYGVIFTIINIDYNITYEEI